MFFYGSNESKKNTIIKLFENLRSNQYEFLIGVSSSSVCNIIIKKIPRIIQLIMTNKNEPSEIINTFYLTHLQFYSNGTKIYGTEKAIGQINTGTSELTGTHVIPYRLVKYFQRGIDLEREIFSNYNFVLNNFNSGKILRYFEQKLYYKKTHSLTFNHDDKLLNFKGPFDFDYISEEKYINLDIDKREFIKYLNVE